MKRELVCIICPKGCVLNVEADADEISVTGNACKRGVTYAVNECTNPVRVVTTTVKTKDGEPVSVKTDRAIPKDRVFDLIKLLSRETLPLPICVGDVIMSDVFGCNVVATQNKE